MTPDPSILLSSLLGLFSLIAVGLLLVRLNILPRSASAPFSSLLMKVALPANVFISMLRPLEAEFLRTALISCCICLAILLLTILLSVPLRRILRIDPSCGGMWQFCVVFSNNGFMGFPLILALFGERGLALAAIISVPYSFIMFSIGVLLIQSDSVQKGDAPTLSLRSILCTAVNAAIVLGLIFYIFQISLPKAILSPIQHLANMTTPLSMIVTGMNLAKSSLRSIFCDRHAITASMVRLLLFPILVGLCLSQLPLDPLIFQVFLVTMAMPTAAASTILGEQHNGATELAARAVSLSSLLCIATIPMITLLL